MMTGILRLERKIAGNGFFVIALFVLTGLLILLLTGGNLIDLNVLGFEVIMPFAAAALMCESVKTRSDPMFDVILANAKSLFAWVVRKFLYVFGFIGLLSMVYILLLLILNTEVDLPKLALSYFATSFLLSSLGILSSFFSRSSHIAICVCGVLWIFNLLKPDYFQYPVMENLYLFAGFIGVRSQDFFFNKITLIAIGFSFWTIIYFICKKRILITG